MTKPVKAKIRTYFLPDLFRTRKINFRVELSEATLVYASESLNYALALASSVANRTPNPFKANQKAS